MVTTTGPLGATDVESKLRVALGASTVTVGFPAHGVVALLEVPQRTGEAVGARRVGGRNGVVEGGVAQEGEPDILAIS